VKERHPIAIGLEAVTRALVSFFAEKKRKERSIKFNSIKEVEKTIELRVPIFEERK
jgi:hypothetical protein